MSQATLPASAMIRRYGGAAMKPRAASSNSRLSANGSVARTSRCNSLVDADGGLPLG
jgi:hypothetical protein